MFNSPTVIVLGAGASAPFGFPLGSDLWKDILADLNSLQQEVDRETPLRQLRRNHPISVDEFAKKPHSSLAHFLHSSLTEHLIGRQITVRELLEFKTEFEIASHDTIDRFLRDNPSQLEIGKILLAQHILLKMYGRDDNRNQMTLRTFTNREYANHRNWYQLLTNRIREGTSSAEQLKKNSLTIVTFNYDLSLEIALGQMLGGTENHSGAKLADVVDILHVNGKPAQIPNSISNVGEFIITAANSLNIVEEKIDSELTEIREKAKSAINSADRVYIMGFHFDPSNIESIGLGDHPHKAKIYSLNFDGHAGVEQRIMQLGIQKTNIKSGSPGNKLHIHTAIDQGFLEQ